MGVQKMGILELGMMLAGFAGVYAGSNIQELKA